MFNNMARPHDGSLATARRCLCRQDMLDLCGAAPVGRFSSGRAPDGSAACLGCPTARAWFLSSWFFFGGRRPPRRRGVRTVAARTLKLLTGFRDLCIGGAPS